MTWAIQSAHHLAHLIALKLHQPDELARAWNIHARRAHRAKRTCRIITAALSRPTPRRLAIHTLRLLPRAGQTIAQSIHKPVHSTA